MKSRYLARHAGRKRGGTSRIVSLPAPTGGWDTSQPLSNANPGTAQIMENVRPTTTGAALRGGSRTVATISLQGAPVETLLTFNGSQLNRLFAASANAIYDVTTPADPVVPPAAAVSGQTSGVYSFVNITTSGDAFLVAVNGTDKLLTYNPAQGWRRIDETTTPAITGIASTALLTFVWPYRNRLFFVQRNSMIARYLPVGSIGGALGTIDLNGVFQRGGTLLFGGTWSMDAGDGLDDKCVFITTEGEVAVFQGSNPGSSQAADWSLVGRYDIGRPLGPKAIMRAGGDLVIATTEGLVPLSAAIDKDAAALNFAAISQPIAPDWQREAVDRQGIGWEIQKWPEKSYAIVTLPVTNVGQSPGAFVVNTLTGRWCRYTGWNMRCLGMHRNNLFFGTDDGRVKIAEAGGTDDGAAIYYRVVGNPEHLGARGVVKSVRQARATFTGNAPFIANLSASVNYTLELPPPPSAAEAVAVNEWDSGKWDQALWDAPAAPPMIRAEWVSIGRTGYVMQYALQITGGLLGTPDTELVSLDFSIDMGGAIV